MSTPTPTIGADMSAAARDVLAERLRQISAEGWTEEHDDAHNNGELAKAAASYAWSGGLPDFHRKVVATEINGKHAWFDNVVLRRLWPWDRKWWKPSDPRRDLVKAGALIIAEIERLDRAAAAKEEK